MDDVTYMFDGQEAYRIKIEGEEHLQAAAETFPQYIYFYGEDLRVEDFVKERIEEMERSSGDPNVAKLCKFFRQVIWRHESWPVLTTTEPTFEDIGSGLDTIHYRLSRQLEWMTEQEYRKKFGTEPPTAPMILDMAQLWEDHPHFNPAWRSE